LLSDKNITIETNDNKQKLVNILLRNGYIDENYLDYISLFHEGSLSKNDHTFRLNIKSQTNTDFNHNLDKIENLIKKIDIDDFKKEYILNYKLTDFLLNNENYSNQRSTLFSYVLINESDYVIQFIKEFIHLGYNVELFIENLCHYWNGSKRNIWKYIIQSSFTDDIVEEFFQLIIKYASVNDIAYIKEGSILKQTISQRKDFCSIFHDSNKIKKILHDLSIKFEDIDINGLPDELLDYIYKNNHYIIKSDLLKIMIQSKGNFNQVDFDTKNYYAILNSKCDVLITYIEENIQEYINNVYIKLEANTKENEEYLIKLLNNENIDEKSKATIIQKVETKVSTLSNIDIAEIENLLFENSKLIPNWADIIDKFISDKNTISKPVLSFINNIENSKELLKYKIDTEKPDKKTVDKFLEILLLDDKTTNNSYSNILKSIPYIYSRLAFENLSKAKVELLIKHNILKLNNDNYTLLRDNFGLHIDLIEKRYYDLSNELLENLNFDNDDIVNILKSQIIPNKNKQSILDSYNEKEIINSAEILEILQTMTLNDSINVNKNILMAILTKTKNTYKRIELYIKKSNELHKNDISAFLQSLPEPYSNIAENGKRPFIEKDKVNLQFVQDLKRKDYISKFEIEIKGLLNKEEGIRISTFRN
jgi:hypothetical protein